WRALDAAAGVAERRRKNQPVAGRLTLARRALARRPRTPRSALAETAAIHAPLSRASISPLAAPFDGRGSHRHRGWRPLSANPAGAARPVSWRRLYDY